MYFANEDVYSITTSPYNRLIIIYIEVERGENCDNLEIKSITYT